MLTPMRKHANNLSGAEEGLFTAPCRASAVVAQCAPSLKGNFDFRLAIIDGIV